MEVLSNLSKQNLTLWNGSVAENEFSTGSTEIGSGAFGYSTTHGKPVFINSTPSWRLINPVRRIFLISDIANATTTLSDIAGLQFNAEANATYKYKIKLFWTSTSTAVGITMSLAGPTMANFFSYYFWTVLSTTALGFSSNTTIETVTSADSSTRDTSIMNGMFTVGGSSGNFYPRFAAETTAGIITIRGGLSYIEYERVA